MSDLKYSDVTPKPLYLSRRKFIAAAAGIGALALGADKIGELLAPAQTVMAAAKLKFTKDTHYSTSEKQNSMQDITHYNNFYEFSVDKEGPAELAGSFHPQPW